MATRQLSVTLATLILCSLTAPAQAQSVPLDPTLKKRLVTITPVTGKSTQMYFDILRDGDNPEVRKEDRYTKNQYAGMPFPVVTKGMSPSPNATVVHSSKLATHKLDKSKLQRPIAIIGDDPQSRIWLSKHANRLKVLRVSVYVVNVHTIPAFKALQTIAPDVHLQAVNGAYFRDELNIKHYPIFISNDGGLDQSW